jgi:fatty-acid desaturase
MDERMFFKVRLYFTGIVTFAIWTLLAWNYYHGGVPSHHILDNKDLPAISNWWGGLLLPFLTWFLLYRIQKRIDRHNNGSSETSNYQKHLLYRFAGALLFGVLLAVFFTFGYSDIPGYMVLGLFPVALFFPIYRAECLLGFVIGMTFTFGAVLPTVVVSILALVCAILYLYVRPLVLKTFQKSPNR